ncbi:MAG TPA: SDR family NAD(P)-dependent oxidoreductase [Kofleriaceae bacterium]|jgi:NAD(P)-dependent dehydrogenase (short-subunit alcohol dehydrogenase family)|nr:SDR family NAD(P)-dependent oxidoreductase [Kofleriaceae bacterium]
MQGRHVVVTGGNGALGRAVVALLEARGAVVHVPDLATVDLANEAAATAYYAALPPLWASIQLAGGFAMARLTETSLADFEQQWRINAVTCFLACREAVRSIRRAAGGGRIVNVAARTVLVPVAGMTGYTAAKAGVAAITQTLAAELAGERILVNAVLPSLIDTPANRAAMPDADHAAWPKPAELAEAIGFLASPDNTLTSGALVPVYGRS